MADQSHALPPVSPASRSRIALFMNKVGVFFTEYWSLILTTFFGLICLAALSAPILMYFNLDALGVPLFHLLNKMCGQIASHSFYIGGHQVGLCVHCLAIYSALFAVGLLFNLSKKLLRGIPWWVMILTSLPLAYDGFSQMFGVRESTWEIRLLTGALFGIGAAWFAFPLIQKELTAAIPEQDQSIV